VRYPTGTAGLDRVSLDVRGDEFVAILGPSGAGKSTLLRSLNRLVDPTGGTLRVFGADVTHITGARLRHLRRQVGMIFQQFNLVERRSVLSNVLAGRFRFTRYPVERPLSAFGHFSGANRRFAMECLARVGIAEKAHERVDALSGGQRQRVAVARVLAQESRVILADEPIASLDPRSAVVVMSTLRKLHAEQRIPVIVNLHQVNMAREFATRIIALRAGRVAFDGQARDFDDRQCRTLFQRAGDDQTGFGEPMSENAQSEFAG
jgi:phosphonate transport system ATP-binding protein